MSDDFERDVHDHFPEDSPRDEESDHLVWSEAHVNVMRCMVTQLKTEHDWRRTNIFHTCTKCNDKSCKVIIDGGSVMYVDLISH